MKSMKVIINDMKAFKLVLTAMAKHDVRFYLNGFAIDGDRLTATDGHRLVSSKCIFKSNAGSSVVTVNFADKTVPAKAKSVVITNDTVTYHVEPDGKGGRVKIAPCNRIDAEYPDYKKVMEKINDLPEKTTNNILINPDYLKELCVAAGKSRCVKMNFKGSERAITLEVEGIESDTDIILLPLRDR